ncbi:MAG: hypothetical protein Q4A81_04270 [Pasteurellaceae bacterium]|nr:hypothetical protein [Pasteurellaceae bacterium]
MKDGYDEFFEKFNISNEKFLEFSGSTVISIDVEKGKAEWEKIKK